MLSWLGGGAGVNLGVDGASLIREAHGKRAEGETLQDSLRRVIANRYPDHQEEVFRATKMLVDMMSLLEGGNARKVNQAILDGSYRLTLVLNVKPPAARPRAGAGTGEGYDPNVVALSEERCPECGGDYLREFNFCLRCGSLWRRHVKGLRRRGG